MWEFTLLIVGLLIGVLLNIDDLPRVSLRSTCCNAANNEEGAGVGAEEAQTC